MPMEESAMKEVKEKVREIEERTHIEIVPFIAKASSDYRYYRRVFSLLSAAALWLLLEHLIPLYYAAGASLLLLIFFELMFRWEYFFRLVTPKGLRNREVMDAAYRVFLEEEVFKTELRSGILIYISKLEHSVYILGDKGFSPYVEDREWSELGVRLAATFSKKGSLASFIEAIESIGERFSKHFPLGEHKNTNQLEDHVRS